MQKIYPIVFGRFIFFFSLLITSCHLLNNGNGRAREEILAVEKEFMEKVGEWGMKDAFVYFGDDSAVLLRNNRLIRGRMEIESYYEQSNYCDIHLTWHPEYVDVSKSGDLAYSYGPFIFSAKDSTGAEIVTEGIFHTVWKKQSDNTWRFVYD